MTTNSILLREMCLSLSAKIAGSGEPVGRGRVSSQNAVTGALQDSCEDRLPIRARAFNAATSVLE